MKLSIIVPVFNENRTIHRVLEEIQRVPIEKEIIVVDDGSTDGTRDILRSEKQFPGLRIIYHEKNQGKGSAVRTGIREASGDAIIIQDADLEYDPMDYLALIDLMIKKDARVVYGSRFLQKRKVTAHWHRFVNFFLTFLTNLLYGSRLTDMETCYKLCRTDLLKKLCINSTGFEIEVELTAKILKLGVPIYEAPVAYKGRSFHEGKKIGWRDGLKAVTALLKYRFIS